MSVEIEKNTFIHTKRKWRNLLSKNLSLDNPFKVIFVNTETALLLKYF